MIKNLYQLSWGGQPPMLVAAASVPDALSRAQEHRKARNVPGWSTDPTKIENIGWVLV